MDYHDTLQGAVKEAIEVAATDLENGEIKAITYLMAQRRCYGDGTYSWYVRLSDCFDSDWVTNIHNDSDGISTDVEKLSAYIEGVWDADWDEVQTENPVGDFSLGSSDFVTR